MSKYSTIGWIATLLGIISFIPQTYKVYKTNDTKSLSLGMYLIINMSFILWIYYGYKLKLTPVLYGNSVLIIMSMYILSQKIKHLKSKNELSLNNVL